MPRKATEEEKLQLMAHALLREAGKSNAGRAAWRELPPDVRDVLEDAASDWRIRSEREGEIEL